MHSPDTPSRNGNSQLSDSWWAALARGLLHRAQLEIIEAMRQSQEPMSAVDLSRVIEGAKSVYLVEHHLRRLRKLGAVAYAEGQASRGIVMVRYRLVRELNSAES
jgi:DNA-binding transcriptional ArsR family regulator